MDPVLEEEVDSCLFGRRNEYPEATSSMDSFGAAAFSSPSSSAVQPLVQLSSHVLQRHSQLSSPK
jgi:hypothetical protein